MYLYLYIIGQGLGRPTATPRRSVWAYEADSPRYQTHCQTVTGFVPAPPRGSGRAAR